MSDNHYQPPQARVDDIVIDAAGGSQPRFYVVAPRKFLILYFALAGSYPLYWFYRNWALQKQVQQSSIWPVMRAIFSVFFTHELFREIDGRLKAPRPGWSWSPASMATLYVVAAVSGNLLGQISSRGGGSPLVSLLSLALIPVIAWPLFTAQQAINLAENDPDGSSNSALTGANWAWIAFGMLLWCFVALGTYAMLMGPNRH